jgi:arabinofuranan 3-O-arabinosyltransferase
MLARQSLVKNLPGIMHGSAPLRSSSSHPCLALLLYSVAYFGWVVASIVPYVVVMRAIVGHNFGVPLALAVPMVCLNALVGQTGFLTAALIGGTLYLIPIRPVLAGICLGLLAHKPQFGLLFPIALIAAGHWRVFVSASVTAIAMFVVSWLAFGTESWLAFFHGMPRCSQAHFTEGRATWWNLQSSLDGALFRRHRTVGLGISVCPHLIRCAGAGADVAKPRVLYLEGRCSCRGALLASPYLYIYDMVVLAIPTAFLVRIGLRIGFRGYELPALGGALVLIACYLIDTPTGLGATLIVSILILARAGSWWPREPVPAVVASGH